MSYDPQKKQAIIDARKADKQQQASETLEKYNTGENVSVADNYINKFKENPTAQKKVREQSEKLKGLKSGKGNFLNNAKIMTKAATPWGIMAIFSQGNILSDWPYVLALIAAILKDVLDFTEATGIGYFMVIVFTLLCSIWIAMMMLLADSGRGRRQQKIIRSWLILLSGTTAEMIFGIDILPIETLTVIIIYALTLMDRKQSHN